MVSMTARLKALTNACAGLGSLLSFSSEILDFGDLSDGPCAISVTHLVLWTLPFMYRIVRLIGYVQRVRELEQTLHGLMDIERPMHGSLKAKRVSQ